MTKPKKKATTPKRGTKPPKSETEPPKSETDPVIPDMDPPGCTMNSPISETLVQTVGDVCACPGPAGTDHLEECPAYQAAEESKAPLERDVYIQVDRTPDLCPFCGCGERTEFQKVRTTEGPIRISGKVWDRVILRRTSCLGCGRKRVDRQLWPEGSVRRAVAQD